MCAMLMGRLLWIYAFMLEGDDARRQEGRRSLEMFDEAVLCRFLIRPPAGWQAS